VSHEPVHHRPHQDEDPIIFSAPSLAVARAGEIHDGIAAGNDVLYLAQGRNLAIIDPETGLIPSALIRVIIPGSAAECIFTAWRQPGIAWPGDDGC
jgi:hypothetical protein